MTYPLDDLPDLGDEGEDDPADSDPKDESADGKDPKSSDKRIRDLQSEKDKETARANKAEKQLKALLAADSGGAEDGQAPVGTGADASESAVLDMARMFAIQQHPKLVEYGYSASDLNGGSPSEVAGNAAALVARIEKIETRARNKALAENGLAPEIDAGSPPTPERDFSKMPKEDFEKVVDEVMGRRR